MGIPYDRGVHQSYAVTVVMHRKYTLFFFFLIPRSLYVFGFVGRGSAGEGECGKEGAVGLPNESCIGLGGKTYHLKEEDSKVFFFFSFFLLFPGYHNPKSQSLDTVGHQMDILLFAFGKQGHITFFFPFWCINDKYTDHLCSHLSFPLYFGYIRQLNMLCRVL